MTSIFHRFPGKELPLAVGGKGAWLTDSDGRRYLDASGGAAVSAIGHGHPRVIEAIKRQAETLAYAHTAFFTNEPSERLAEFLIARAPARFGKVFFCSGGSEATETTLKLARQYHVANGETGRTIFIARHQSYHGATLGALSMSGNPGRRAPYEPILPRQTFIEPCYPYRLRRDGESAEDYGLRAANALEAAILDAGPDRVAAFIAEPVVGATLGAVAAAPGYFTRVREICDRYGVLFIADEVMCGMGRTGSFFACEQDNVAPDIIAVAKGLAAGYQAMGATLVSQSVYDTITAHDGKFEHGFTFIGHPIGCAAALAVQETIEDDGLLANVVKRGAQLRALLKERLAPFNVVGDIRGRGLMIGIELVSDPATKAPFPPSLRLHARIKNAAMDEGLIVYPNGGCVDGVHGDHILLAPPYILSEDDVAEIADRLTRAVCSALPVVPA